MRIDSVSTQPDQVGKYKVRFSDGSAMRLYRQTIQDHCLYAGLELSDEVFSRLRIDAGKMSAKMRAVRIVAASSVSKADLQHRLIQKGEDPAYAELAVSWMEDMDLLDDEKTAHQIVSKCIDKGYGRARAKQALYEKRIPRDLWDVALEDYPDQTEKILAYLRAKLTDTQDEKAVRRVTDALMRRGHDYGQIKSAIRQLNMQLQEDF